MSEQDLGKEVPCGETPSETRDGFITYAPGTWVVADDCANEDEVCVVPSCCFDALTVKDITGTLDHDPTPRARLIAAAPDLLAALKYCVIERSEWLEEARAAISKATGQQP